jgi:hypothetical protein
MAINPNPDRNTSIMQQDFGTVCLITDLQADKYLQNISKKTNEPPNNRYSRPCGGKGGFDDYVERWHY